MLELCAFEVKLGCSFVRCGDLTHSTSITYASCLLLLMMCLFERNQLCVVRSSKVAVCSSSEFTLMRIFLQENNSQEVSGSETRFLLRFLIASFCLSAWKSDFFLKFSVFDDGLQ